MDKVELNSPLPGWEPAGWAVRMGARYQPFKEWYQHVAATLETRATRMRWTRALENDDVAAMRAVLEEGLISEPNAAQEGGGWGPLASQAVRLNAGRCAVALATRLPLGAFPWRAAYQWNLFENLPALQAMTHALWEKHGPSIADFIKPCLQRGDGFFDFQNLMAPIEREDLASSVPLAKADEPQTGKVAKVEKDRDEKRKPRATGL